jgi:dUTP pyrophosphatase
MTMEVHMRYLEGDAVAAVLTEMISANRQQHHYETDLTAGSIYRVTGPGAVDFWGSEEESAPRELIQPKKKAAQDNYGWWELQSGTYVLRFNEVAALTENQIGFVQPHERLVRAGATHPSCYFREERESLETSLTVGAGGVRTKENARVSKMLLLELGRE